MTAPLPDIDIEKLRELAEGAPQKPHLDRRWVDLDADILLALLSRLEAAERETPYEKTAAAVREYEGVADWLSALLESSGARFSRSQAEDARNALRKAILDIKLRHDELARLRTKHKASRDAARSEGFKAGLERAAVIVIGSSAVFSRNGNVFQAAETFRKIARAIRAERE